MTIKIAEAALEDFDAFFKSEGSLSGVSSGSRGMAESGPSRHKSAVFPASFPSSLASRDWTAPDEKFLRESFWVSMEFDAHKDSFERLLDAEQLKLLGNERLFCERISACKPLFQCIGALLINSAGPCRKPSRMEGGSVGGVKGLAYVSSFNAIILAFDCFMFLSFLNLRYHAFCAVLLLGQS